MYTEFDHENWERKHLFHFFKEYDDPFFNITGQVDITALYRFCKDRGYSFFLSSLFYCTYAANLIRNFRLRLLDGKVVEYDKIHAGSTILYDDDTFGFAYFDYSASFFQFVKEGKKILEQYKQDRSFSPRDDEINMIHFSIIPWVAFTSFKHARRHGTSDSIPKIVMGKIFDSGTKKMMPVSVEVHHALMDGLHVGQFFQVLQDELDKADQAE